MRGRRSGWIWVGRAVAVAVVAGLGGYMLTVGLDKADKLAAALSLLVAVGALVAPYLLSAEPSVPGRRSSAQTVLHAVIRGHLTQARNTGSLRVEEPSNSAPVAVTPPASSQVEREPGGQHIDGVWVDGNVTQIDGVDGDVTLG